VATPILTGGWTWLRQALGYLPVAWLATAIALGCTGYTADSSGSTQQARGGQDTAAAREVRVAAVAQRPLERATVALGSLAAYDQATISVKVSGRLHSILVDLGSVVQQGRLSAPVAQSSVRFARET
jgi:multidrug efflux pump subunit AcrA (membrane-fusion protein)